MHSEDIRNPSRAHCDSVGDTSQFRGTCDSANITKERGKYMKPINVYKKCLCCGNKYPIDAKREKCLCDGHLYVVSEYYQEKPVSRSERKCSSVG